MATPTQAPPRTSILTPEMIAEWPETYVRKCLLAPREGDNLFFLTQSDHWLATIEGYAIIPMEMYERLTKQMKDQPEEKTDQDRV